MEIILKCYKNNNNNNNNNKSVASPVYTVLVWFCFFWLGPFSSFDGKFNTTTHNIILDNGILPTLWQQIVFCLSLFKLAESQLHKEMV